MASPEVTAWDIKSLTTKDRPMSKKQETEEKEVLLQEKYWVTNSNGGFDTYAEAEESARKYAFDYGERLIVKAVALVKPAVAATEVEKFV